MLIDVLSSRYNWYVSSFRHQGLTLTCLQARNYLLPELSRLRIPPEPRTAALPCREVDEVCPHHPAATSAASVLTHDRSINIFVWGVALCAHAACHNFAGLFVVRLILGMCEGSITAGFMIVSSMFYTRTEQTLRVGYWCKSRGVRFSSDADAEHRQS